MQKNRLGATPEEQVIQHAKNFFEVRERRRAADLARNKVEYEAAKKAEYICAKELDKAVRRLPP